MSTTTPMTSARAKNYKADANAEEAMAADAEAEGSVDATEGGA